jgi:hypothetical protein
MHMIIGIDSTKFTREARPATLRAFGLLCVGGRHHAEDLLLVRPDQHPDVEHHDGTEPGAGADHAVVVRILHADAEREGADEFRPQQPRAAQPGGHRAPAEPEQCPRGDVLADARASRAALVGGGIGHGRSLGYVEVIKEPDPEHAGDDVEPARETQLVEMRAANQHRQDHGKDDPEDEGLAVIVQGVHSSVSKLLFQLTGANVPAFEE